MSEFSERGNRGMSVQLRNKQNFMRFYDYPFFFRDSTPVDMGYGYGHRYMDMARLVRSFITAHALEPSGM